MTTRDVCDVLIDDHRRHQLVREYLPDGEAAVAHDDTPHSELFHKTVGAGVGMVDRQRDALSGRLTS